MIVFQRHDHSTNAVLAIDAETARRAYLHLHRLHGTGYLAVFGERSQPHACRLGVGCFFEPCQHDLTLKLGELRRKRMRARAAETMLGPLARRVVRSQECSVDVGPTRLFCAARVRPHGVPRGQ